MKKRVVKPKLSTLVFSIIFSIIMSVIGGGSGWAFYLLLDDSVLLSFLIAAAIGILSYILIMSRSLSFEQFLLASVSISIIVVSSLGSFSGYELGYSVLMFIYPMAISLVLLASLILRSAIYEYLNVCSN